MQQYRLRILPKRCRLRAFWSVIQHQVTDADYWHILRWLWVMNEGPGSDRSWLLVLFTSERGAREHLMTAGELMHYRSLPLLVELYRGAAPRGARGMSWTSDLDEAARWARRFFGNVYQATVGREAILACFDGRGESEMVIDPRQLPPLRAMHWTPAEVDLMAERAGHRKQTRKVEAFESYQPSEFSYWC